MGSIRSSSPEPTSIGKSIRSSSGQPNAPAAGLIAKIHRAGEPAVPSRDRLTIMTSALEPQGVGQGPHQEYRHTNILFV